MKKTSLSETLEIISKILEKMIKQNESKKPIKSVFETQNTKMKLTISSYLQRIANYSKISFESAIISLIYIDRLIIENKDFFLT